MTRDEAVKVILSVYYPETDLISHEKLHWAEKSSDVLVALGLLKLDEPKPHKWTPLEAVKICRATYHENEAFIEGLEAHGYKIVKA